MWVVHNITTTKDEGCKGYPNKTNSIQEWNAKKVIVDWFQNMCLDISIGVVEGLEDSRAPRQTANSYTTFYNNLQTLFSQNNYKLDHIWNSDETCIQVAQQVGARILAERGSHIIYNTILKYQEWLIIHYVVNVVRSTLPRFYIFKREQMKNDYIKYCKVGPCMVM